VSPWQENLRDKTTVKADKMRMTGDLLKRVIVMIHLESTLIHIWVNGNRTNLPSLKAETFDECIDYPELPE
jgi:hypothetical protein